VSDGCTGVSMQRKEGYITLGHGESTNREGQGRGSRRAGLAMTCLRVAVGRREALAESQCVPAGGSGQSRCDPPNGKAEMFQSEILDDDLLFSWAH